MGKVATRGSPVAHKCKVASGIPTASERGAKSEVAHKWARWLRHPCRLPAASGTASKRGAKSEVAHIWAKWLLQPCRGDPLRFRAGGKIRGYFTPAEPCGGQSQNWPINGQGGYITLAASGIPTASERGAKSGPINGQGGYVTPAASGIATASERGAKSEVTHKWAKWLHHPCRLGDPHRLTSGGNIKSGP